MNYFLLQYSFVLLVVSTTIEVERLKKKYRTYMREKYSLCIIFCNFLRTNSFVKYGNNIRWIGLTSGHADIFDKFNRGTSNNKLDGNMIKKNNCHAPF